MRKILSTLMLLLTVAFLSKGQDVKPIDPINFKALQSPSWSYMTLDSAVWIYKGSTYGWTKIHGDTHLKRYYVPYDNALRDVNLGDKKITSTKQRLPLFNGACVVPTITDNGNGSITVSNGEYHLSTNVDGRGTENFLINGGTFALTDQTQNYLVADYNSGTPILKVVTDVNLINETTVIPIYTAYRNGIFLHFQNWDSLGLALANKVHQSIVKTQRYRREYGLIVTEYGTHNLNMTAGRVWVGVVPVDIAEINTGVDNLSIWYHSGDNWVNSIQPTYNFTQWDNGTNLVTLTNNRYAVNWIFRGIENQKHLYIVLGRGDYSLDEAEASSMPPIPTAISSHATLVAKLIVEKNAATATNIKSAFEVQFSLASVQKHDDLTGRDVVNSHPASAISNTPAGNISSTNVQAAINELDTEKVAKVSSSDNAVVRFDGTGGSIQNSSAYLFDSGNFYIGNNTENSYSRMLVYGGTNGANLDVRGEAGTFTDQATVEVMGNDYDTTTRSAYLQFKGSTHTGSTLGYTNANLSQLVMNGDNNLIYSSLAKPIIFGTNNQRSGILDIDGKLVLDSLSSTSPSIVTASTSGKLDKATFTTTGNSGAATFSLNNLNIPHYTLSGLGAGTAANNNTGDFILNQNSSAQTANGWITGTFDASGYKLSSTSLLLDWLKSGSAPASGNIVVGNGTTTNPSGVSVNQAIGGNALSNSYLLFWDGSKASNSRIRIDSPINTVVEKNLSIWYKTDASEGAVPVIVPSATTRGFKIIEGFGSGDFIEFLDDRRAKIPTLSGTGTRLVSSTSDGTLSNITNGTEGQVLKIVSGVPQFAVSSGGLSVTPYVATSNSNYTLDLNTYINSRSSTNTNITITLSNLDDGETGNIEVTYTGAAVITFVVDSSYTINMADNIRNTTTNAYTKSVTSMSSGTATYSYYRSGNNVKIHGTQYYQ